MKSSTVKLHKSQRETNYSQQNENSLIIRKINDNEVSHKRTYKADEISRTFQN